MQLPVRLSSAQSLLKSSSSMMEQYFTSGQEYKSLLLQTLESQYQQLKVICENMLHALGYTGDLDTMELELSNRIRQLQGQTFFMNGEALWDFIIRDLSNAIAYDPKMQDKFSIYFNNIVQSVLDENSIGLTDENMKKIAQRIFDDIGFNTQEYILTIGGKTEGRPYVRGYGKMTKGKGGSTAKIYMDDIWASQSNFLRKELVKKQKENGPSVLDNITVSSNSEGFIVNSNFNPNTIYSLLKMSTTGKGKTASIYELINSQEVIIQVKQFLKNRLIERRSGDSIFSWCVNEVVNKAEARDLFAGQNAPNKITGLIGEIQALYFIRTILNEKGSTAEASWFGAQFQGGAQPHADIILSQLGKQFGIQVKNTTRAAAEQEITFQTFKSEAFKFAQGQKLDSFLLGGNFDNIIERTNQPLFEAISTILLMEGFNIPYKWMRGEGGEGGTATEASINEVPLFADTRKEIVENAEKARRLINIFSAAMMFMQMQNDIHLEKGASNSLYIIGGSLAITSASIILDIINKLKNEIQSFNMEVSFRKEGARGSQTIIDFFNANKGASRDKYYIQMQSSYTF